MKNSIKFLFAAIIIAAFSVNSYAQTNQQTSMDAKANVLTSLTITKNTDVDYKNISATTPGVVRLVPTGSGHAYVGQGATTGKLTITAEDETAVLITYPDGVVLASGVNTMTYSMHVHGNTEDVQSTSSELSGEGIAGSNVNRTTHTDGKYFLFIGGALGGTIASPAPLSGQATGQYTGSVVFQVKYN